MSLEMLTLFFNLGMAGIVVLIILLIVRYATRG